MDTTQELISGYLDGELTETEIARLSTTLQSNTLFLDRLVWCGLIHWQLLEWMEHATSETNVCSSR